MKDKFLEILPKCTKVEIDNMNSLISKDEMELLKNLPTKTNPLLKTSKQTNKKIKKPSPKLQSEMISLVNLTIYLSQK